ncbi:MAG: ParB/RepB/Spo0J family partition protein [Rhodospirillales bacterium]|nr:ParB/RepB/Spo0J family partition protein [Alphaproteobacteria bacterium]MCB9986624.1 ParB/RepB/Spo0J family partition protein [Rhodospirillales bacterium]USO08597.1 MAG: ParB/RepB/Spo0J family partition protein [Rhodospirillales bacterium]
MDNRKKGLGRGLNALFGDEEAAPQTANDRVGQDTAGESAGRSRMMPVEWLRPNPNQPRRVFTQEALDDLAGSILQHGMLQPILARPVPEAGNRYEIVAGERRWRAAQAAQLHEVPVTIQYLTDEAVLELGLIENLQREDLSPLEEAEAYQQLMTRFGHTQDKVAAAVGKSRSHIANMIRLLTLPEPVKQYLREGTLTAGHARTLITAADPTAMAKAMVEGGLSVREAEALTNKKKGKLTRGRAGPQKDTDTLALEREMTGVLGMPVTISVRKGKKGARAGSISIQYANLDQLDDVLHRLSHGAGRKGL